MKSLTTPKHFLSCFVLLGLLALGGCNDNNDPSLVAKTQFAASTLTVSENGGEQSIVLAFDRPVPSDGEIIISASSIAPACYSTTPVLELGQVRIPVFKGDISRAFKMTPTDNSNLDGLRVVKFKISSVSQGLAAGSSNEMIVSVTDDEAEADAGFESTEFRVRENDPSATRIEIVFAHAVAAGGTLVVNIQSNGAYGLDYTTLPAAAAGKIFVQVSKGATSASINLYAINDNTFKADRNVKFTIVDATGGVTVGANDSFLLTITDDDGEQLADIVSIRSLYTGSIRILPNNTYIEGVVTSVNNTSAGRVVVQDETGALPIQLLTEEIPQRGDVILLDLSSAQLRELSGILEVGPISTYEKIGEDSPLITKMSIPELLSLGKRIESTTVQLNNVTFTQANGTSTLRGDRTLTDGDETIIVRTGSLAAFGNDIVPMGQVNVTGIFTYTDGLYVLYPQESKDIKKQGLTPIRGGLTREPR